MASNESTLRLKFLQNSAKLLSTQSASTAAHLMTVHNHLLYADSKPLKQRQHEFWCGACGGPRDNEHTKISKIKPKINPRKHQVDETVVYQCLRCHKRTIRHLQPQIRKQRDQSDCPTNTQAGLTHRNQNLPTTTNSLPRLAEVSSTSDVSKSTSDNASSKKRAKARKQGGLQALLASKQRSQPSSASASSLDLLDFLQQ